jgi:peptide/nickel transport system substrate-binding protein
MIRRRNSSYLLVLLMAVSASLAFGESQLRFCLRSEPKSFNPLLVTNDSEETIRYLTGGVLVRVNRQTQNLDPELALSWKVTKDGRHISFKLRTGVVFSDGTPFSAADVAYTVQQLMDPALHSPTGDAFRSGTGAVNTQVVGSDLITITFPAPVAGLDRLFDQVAILSAHSPKKELAVLGPFVVSDYKPGTTVLLQRNTHYWKKDAKGRALPYLDSIRLEVQSNRDIETLRFKRGELDLINSLDSEYYDRLASSSSTVVHDAGPSLDSEQMWFNQVANAPIPDYKRKWFRSTTFRRAVSQAINREDLSRVVFNGHARSAVGPISPVNKFWFNSRLKVDPFNSEAALQKLQLDGFRLQNGVLKDSNGNNVEFSIITNSGNKYRERMALLIQEDLGKIGIKVNVVTLDFPSLIERISQSFNYEGAILGLTNVDLDPNGQMNVWLSSSENHQWNPQEKSPETTWEAEIDQLMRTQSSTNDPQKRKKSFDRVQEIVAEQVPFIYLVNRNALSAISSSVQGATPVVLRPQTYWNIEMLALADAKGR